MAELIAPNQSLKQKVGNSSAADDLRSLDGLQGVLEKLNFEFIDIIQQEVKALQGFTAPYRTENLQQIYQISHCLRGLAGSFSHLAVSQFADNLCKYIDGFEDDSLIDDRLVQAHINAICMFVSAEDSKTDASNALLSAMREAISQKPKPQIPV